jgi:hypothetical protein
MDDDGVNKTALLGTIPKVDLRAGQSQKNVLLCFYARHGRESSKQASFSFEKRPGFALQTSEAGS